MGDRAVTRRRPAPFQPCGGCWLLSWARAPCGGAPPPSLLWAWRLRPSAASGPGCPATVPGQAPSRLAAPCHLPPSLASPGSRPHVLLVGGRGALGSGAPAPASPPALLWQWPVHWPPGASRPACVAPPACQQLPPHAPSLLAVAAPPCALSTHALLPFLLAARGVGRGAERGHAESHACPQRFTLPGNSVPVPFCPLDSVSSGEEEAGAG